MPVDELLVENGRERENGSRHGPPLQEAVVMVTKNAKESDVIGSINSAGVENMETSTVVVWFSFLMRDDVIYFYDYNISSTGDVKDGRAGRGEEQQSTGEVGGHGKNTMSASLQVWKSINVNIV